MNGKGDARRPMNISDKEFARRWELAFGKEKQTTEDNQARIPSEVPDDEAGSASASKDMDN